MPLLKFLDDITKVKVYPIDDEVKTVISSDYRYGISDTNCSIDYIEKFGNYDNVIEILDNNRIGSVSIDINLFSEVRSASIEFFIKTSNTSKGFWLNSSLSRVTNGFSISIASGSFFYFNGSSYVKIIDIENDSWYQIRIDFECTNNNYSGLNINQWKITINGIEYGNYDFWNDISFVNYLELFTSQLEAEKYIDIYGELIPFFYKNKLYEYKSLTIYYSG